MNSAQNPETEQENLEQTDPLTARKIALDMLEQIIDRKNALDIVLDRTAEFASLPPRDRGFTRMLLTTTLRRLGQIDDLLNFAQDKPESLRTPLIRNILRIGITQLFFMDVPDHAAVDTSVKLVEDADMPRQKDFVNAILRKLTREGADRVKNQDAARLNTPEWLMKYLVEDYGLKTAAEIMQAHMKEPPLDITVKDVADRPYWGNALQAAELSTGTLRRALRGNIRELEGFDQGKWWVQDAAAAIPATLFGDIKDKHVIDTCAAPGGKTLQLASMGATVTAIDRSARRLQRLNENLERMQLQDKVTVDVADATEWRPKEPPQYILIDAPCSATGTIRRHPDTPYLKSPKDVESLMGVQERLLHHAADILAPNGTLIYCTCSLQKSEGEHQIDRFLQKRLDFIRSPIKPDEIGKYNELINTNGDLRILPSHLAGQGGIDGFFIARITRTQ